MEKANLVDCARSRSRGCERWGFIEICVLCQLEVTSWDDEAFYVICDNCNECISTLLNSRKEPQRPRRMERNPKSAIRTRCEVESWRDIMHQSSSISVALQKFLSLKLETKPKGKGYPTRSRWWWITQFVPLIYRRVLFFPFTLFSSNSDLPYLVMDHWNSFYAGRNDRAARNSDEVQHDIL
jgi:hypothetical protein